MDLGVSERVKPIRDAVRSMSKNLRQTMGNLASMNVEEVRANLREQVRNEAQDELRVMRREIVDLGCECPKSQTNFLFVVPKHYTGDVCGELEAQGIIVRPMPPAGGASNTFRVNTGTPVENRRFLDALKGILS